MYYCAWGGGILDKDYLTKQNNEKMQVAVYLEGEKSSTFPTISDGYYFDREKSNCSDNAAIEWDYKSWEPVIVNVTATRTKCNFYFKKCDSSTSISYSGKSTSFTSSCSGYYKFELWGASGGNASGFRENYGGNGAYTSGILFLTEPTTFYIEVGGVGQNAKTEGFAYDENPRISNGGYNGGGTVTGGGNCCGAGGGGATHMALKSGLLSSLETSLDSVLMVAAGGGGASRDFKRDNFEGHGGAGGIIKGFDGNSAGNTQCLAYGATTIAGGISSCKFNGSFGYNSYVGSSSLFIDGGGGGSGYYAGGSAVCSGGGGGSSYINGDSRFTINNQKYSFIETQAYDGTQVMPSHEGNSTIIGNNGNGFARITYLG